jgi:hypothetical protein
MIGMGGIELTFIPQEKYWFRLRSVETKQNVHKVSPMALYNTDRSDQGLLL